MQDVGSLLKVKLLRMPKKKYRLTSKFSGSCREVVKTVEVFEWNEIGQEAGLALSDDDGALFSPGFTLLIERIT